MGCNDGAAFGPWNLWRAEALSLEDFCIAESRAEWLRRETGEFGTMLHFPWAVLTMTKGGECSAVVAPSASVAVYVHGHPPIELRRAA